MPTSYPGREDEFDLGKGHSFRWFEDEEGIFGLIEHHPVSAAGIGYEVCGGYIAWRESQDLASVSKHQLVSGGPGEEEKLTISPSIQCRECSNHGFIKDGKWVPA